MRARLVDRRSNHSHLPAKTDAARCQKFAGSSSKRAPLAEALCELEAATSLWDLEQPGDGED